MSSQSLLRKKTINAVLWSGAGQFGAQAIHYFSLMTLAWLLPPAAFGLLGLVMIFVLIAEGIDLGLGAAIIQKANVTEPVFSTVFWTNLSINVAIAVLCWPLAEPITAFLGDIQGTWILRVLSLVFPLTALSVVPQAVLRKQLEFRLIALREGVSEVGFGIVGVALAVSGCGVWSLVGAVLTQRLIGTLSLWVVIDWRPSFRFSLKTLGELIRFGGPFLAGALVHRVLLNVDYFVVGHWFGTAALGYYTLAFQLAAVPQQRIVAMLSRVAFPALSLIQNDLDRLRRAFLQGIRHLFAALLPISICITFVGPWLIKAVYQENWLASIPALQLLGIAGLFHAFDTVQALYFAVGKPGIRLQLMLLRSVTFILVVLGYGLTHGIVGIAASTLASLIISGVVEMGLAVRILKITPHELFQTLWPSLCAGCVAILPILIILLSTSNPTSPWRMCIILSSSILMLYAVGQFPFYRKIVRDALGSKREVQSEAG